MKVKFLTLGCKVNQYETQALREDCVREGFEVTEDRADVYVVNTCSVTHRADRKSREAIGKARRENPGGKIAAIGCLAELNRDMLIRLGVDYVLSQKEKYSLGDVLRGREGKTISPWSLSVTESSLHRAFVKIQDGCDNFCTFCKIPHLRGPSRSRGAQDIIAEIKRLCVRHPEIVLCGVNASLYGKDIGPQADLCRLIRRCLDIRGLRRLRLSSLESLYLDERLLELLVHPKFCPHLHLSFQSGDDRILQAMNKKETAAQYRKIISQARTIHPDTAISGDIIVGFPGEDRESFDRTVGFLEEIRPMRLHVFQFSPRAKTPLEHTRMGDQKEIKRRSVRLKSLAKEWAYAYAKTFAGRRVRVIAEEKKGKYFCGYSQHYLRVNFTGDVPLGEMVQVKITRVSHKGIYGVIV